MFFIHFSSFETQSNYMTALWWRITLNYLSHFWNVMGENLFTFTSAMWCVKLIWLPETSKIFVARSRHNIRKYNQVWCSFNRFFLVWNLISFKFLKKFCTDSVHFFGNGSSVMTHVNLVKFILNLGSNLFGVRSKYNNYIVNLVKFVLNSDSILIQVSIN